ncbi:MAG: hypothetical protein DWQ40_04200 [Actinobacteria bacterium]|nr:MAG: hypothetical protein DWQ40_04200 [Actinomycetota bacterium]REK41029.1 MAG: hypothetical protein DWQ20_00520 [Actinomycetota bacterium]
MTSSRQDLPRADLLRDIAEDLDQVIQQGLTSPDRSIETDLEEMISMIRNYLVPRIEDPNAPFNVVFAGPTGSGKSTLINSVVGRVVSEAGVKRPTTSTPVVYTHTTNARARAIGDVDVEVSTGDARILRFISLIDTPDIDSTTTENHETALDLVASADLVVFVASALRYADLVPWQVMRAVTRRGIPVVHVLNRVSPENVGSVVDYRRRLSSEHMDPEVIAITEHRSVDGILPLPAVQQLRGKILDLISELNRHIVLEASIQALRSELSAMAYALNSDLLERVGPGYPRLRVDPSWAKSKVTEWRREIDSASGWFERLLRRRKSRETLEGIARDIEEELVTLIEQDLRSPSAAERLVVDLTDPEDVSIHLQSVDSAISGWFRSLGPPGEISELSAAGLSARLQAAVDEFEAVALGGLGAEAVTLGATLDELAISTGRARPKANEGGQLLDVVQRARARLRSEPTLSGADV